MSTATRATRTMARWRELSRTGSSRGCIVEKTLKKENEKGGEGREGGREGERWRRRCFGGRLKQCGRSDNAGVTGLRRIHGPWTRMDLNENLLINNKQARARSRLPFPRDIPLSLSPPSLSLWAPCASWAARGWRDRRDGSQTGPEHEDGCGPRRRRHLAGLLPDFQLYSAAKGTETGSTATPCTGRKNFLR